MDLFRKTTIRNRFGAAIDTLENAILDVSDSPRATQLNLLPRQYGVSQPRWVRTASRQV